MNCCQRFDNICQINGIHTEEALRLNFPAHFLEEIAENVSIGDYALDRFSRDQNLENDILRRRSHIPLPQRPNHFVRSIGSLGFSITHLAEREFFIYRHFTTSLNTFIQAYRPDIIWPNQLTLLFNFDGTKVQERKLWPLQCLPFLPRHNHNFAFQPFIVGIFMGTSQPNLRRFVQSLVDDLTRCRFRFRSSAGQDFEIVKIHFCVDAQARANLMGVWQHNACCEVCGQVPTGRNRLYELNDMLPLVTDVDYRARVPRLANLRRGNVG
ncbi:hypothetical protein Ciccas_011526 [Cichlidogyrus casuarinus]|uniref:Transposase n=1 Tax=Cichlidogyrus casuarinus TaxID=1844966 RepID=A0ABD2PR10_9PLAT